MSNDNQKFGTASRGDEGSVFQADSLTSNELIYNGLLHELVDKTKSKKNYRKTIQEIVGG